MSDVVSFAEIDGQHVELLPARTLLQVGGGAAGEAVTPAVEPPAVEPPAAEATGPGAAVAV